MKLKPLLIWTVPLILLAIGAVVVDWYVHAPERRGMVGRALLPERHLPKIGIIVIESEAGQVTLRRGKQGWTVDEHDGSSADEVKLRDFLLHLTQVRVNQKVPVHPDRLGDFALLKKVENDWRFEQHRTGRLISLFYGEENRHILLYRLLIGKRRISPDPSGPHGTYVRFPATNNVYLVGDPLLLDIHPRDWAKGSGATP